MDEQTGLEMVAKALYIRLSRLSDDDLVALNLKTALGADPRTLRCYDEIADLFTERDAHGYPKLHDVTAQALDIVVWNRLSAPAPATKEP